jgi:hypothetical protein
VGAVKKRRVLLGTVRFVQAAAPKRNRFPKVPAIFYHPSDLLTYFFSNLSGECNAGWRARAHRVPAICYAPIMRPLCVQTVLGLDHRSHNVPTTRPLCAHYAPTMRANRFGGEAMSPPCAHYAPNICPNRFLGQSVGPTVCPLCAHYAPTMRPICV